MKYIIIFISVLLLSNNFCFSQVQLSILNKERIIKDTIIFKVKNQSNELISFDFSIEVLIDKWQELYDNIYEFNRDKVQRFEIAQKSNKKFMYSISKISKSYQKLFNGKRFRLVMKIFPVNPLEDLKIIKSNSFILRWPS